MPPNATLPPLVWCLGAIQAGANIVRVMTWPVSAQFLNGYWAAAAPAAPGVRGPRSNSGRRLDNIRAAKDLIAEIPMTCVSNCSCIYERAWPHEERQEPFCQRCYRDSHRARSGLFCQTSLMEVENNWGASYQERTCQRAAYARLRIFVDGRRSSRRRYVAPAASKPGERDFVLIP